jgi:hypothetical protein
VYGCYIERILYITVCIEELLSGFDQIKKNTLRIYLHLVFYQFNEYFHAFLVLLLQFLLLLFLLIIFWDSPLFLINFSLIAIFNSSDAGDHLDIEFSGFLE